MVHLSCFISRETYLLINHLIIGVNVNKKFLRLTSFNIPVLFFLFPGHKLPGKGNILQITF